MIHDLALLSRIHLALTVMFHYDYLYLFPPLTIGMSVVLVWREPSYLKTRDGIGRLPLSSAISVGGA